MSFVTDKQTLADLNLLGKYKVGSMFNLFNRVQTRGGELLLEEMFRMPLSDAAAINARSACIQYLRELDVKASFNREITEQASQLLTQQRPASPLTSLFSCYSDKIRQVLYRSQKLHLQQAQIKAMQEVLLAAGSLLEQLQKKDKPGHPCSAMQQQLEKIVRQPAFKQLDAKYPYTVWQTVRYHYLFLNTCRQSLVQLLHLLYEFDVYISVAAVAAGEKLHFARADDADKTCLLEAEDLRHPALPQAVANSVSLTRRENLLFLTGANMAGKSTWMKTLGISFYLAHMGFPVAAATMRFSVMDGIFTSINVPDDISLGWSHFYAEVMRVKLVAKEVSSGKRLFILFDELFKGTNVKDAYDATLAVTQRLARYRSCAFVVSTHIIEVGEALSSISNIQFYYMPTVMKAAVPHYTYRLTPGITADRQGMMIIENEKIFEMLAR